MYKYKKGDVIKCKVTKTNTFGAFVVVDENHTGLVHISQISDYYVPDVKSHINEGDEIDLEVIEYNQNEKSKTDKLQLRLSFKSIRPELLKEKATTSTSFEAEDSEIEQK